MGKRGPKPKRLVSEKWRPELAYAIGLLASDGCLAKNVTLVDLTSKDREQLGNFCRCIGVDLRIGEKSSGFGQKDNFRVQLKNVFFYNFLLSVGLTPAKSKTLGALRVPRKYFFDFLRGLFDGDGSTYSYWDKRWRSSFMFYVCFASASPDFLRWLRRTLFVRLRITGHITCAERHSTIQLKYAKEEGLKILRRMYRDAPKGTYLSRTHVKITRM